MEFHIYGKPIREFINNLFRKKIKYYRWLLLVQSDSKGESFYWEKCKHYISDDGIVYGEGILERYPQWSTTSKRRIHFTWDFMEGYLDE